jgi:AraC family transcriptional regulator
MLFAQTTIVPTMEIPKWFLTLVDQIEEQITSDISLDRLASNTGYSLRHLQRQFKTLTKENLGDYIRGRRLSMAMADIMAGNKSTLDIALAYGFQSQESFTRAFQARFAFPPRRFRLNKVDNPITLRTKIDADYLRFINSGSLTLEPTLTNLSPMTFAGISARVDQNSFQSPDWAQTLLAIFAKLAATQFQPEPSSPASYLVSYRATGSHGIHMLAAKQYAREPELPEGCESFTAPGGHYAVFRFKGVADQLFQRGNYILGTWLPQSGYWLGNGPAIVELKFDQSSKRLTANSYIPLRRRNLRSYDPWWE